MERSAKVEAGYRIVGSVVALRPQIATRLLEAGLNDGVRHRRWSWRRSNRGGALVLGESNSGPRRIDQYRLELFRVRSWRRRFRGVSE